MIVSPIGYTNFSALPRMKSKGLSVLQIVSMAASLGVVYYISANYAALKKTFGTK
jgi:hypothetical protein